MGEYLTITVADGSFQAFVERPTDGEAAAPVVVVLHEVFGVNEDIRASCRDLSDRGFIAMAPDLFWRQEPDLSLSQWTEAEWQKGLALYQTYDRDRGTDDIVEVVNLARTLPGASGKVGVMGYCLGGLMTFLVTARYGADASVAYYPGSADEYTSEASNVRTPLVVHLAEEDEFITPPARHTIGAALGERPLATVFSYPGCSHAFARHTGVHFDAAVAALANERTWSFLREQLS